MSRAPYGAEKQHIKNEFVSGTNFNFPIQYKTREEDRENRETKN
jgi:hypothetical protein